jgi:hypothetical protein
MQYLVILILIFWAAFGEPKKNIANSFYEFEAAPWETVDAFFYPDSNDLTQYQKQTGFNSVDECRDWVFSMAQQINDASMLRSDYECGIEIIDQLYDLSIYRTTVK